jgi:hypothetical protein
MGCLAGGSIRTLIRWDEECSPAMVIQTALFAIGALSTIPLAVEVLGSPRPSADGNLRVQRNPVSPYVMAS